MRTKLIASAAAAALFLSASAASAVSVGVKSFGSLEKSSVNIAGALAAQDAFHLGTTLVAFEDFESFTLTGTPAYFQGPAGVITGATGTFASTGGSGTGNTVVGTASQVAVRDGSGTAGGRYDTSSAAAGGQYLDSNDTDGIKVAITNPPLTAKFDRLSFMTTDVNDVSKLTFNLNIDGATPINIGTLLTTGYKTNGFRHNGELLLFTLVFPNLISATDLALTIQANDGFAIDNLKLTATPLPAAAWMLIAGVAGLLGMRRFSTKTA